VVAADRAVTIPPSELARLSAAVPGQRVRVRIEKVPSARRTLFGAFAKPDRATLTIGDFDAISDELWAGRGYGRD
jgi:hypothetical protein